VSVGLPGTGLYWTEQTPASHHQPVEPITAGKSDGPPAHAVWLWVMVAAIVLTALIIAFTQLPV
jgi:hypothetical protein